MNRTVLPDDFVYGVATASYQVEGAAFEDGRTSCIWDDYAKIPGAVADSNDGRVAADQYHHIMEDIEIMYKLGFDSYRFSISWTRVFPNGGTVINQKGLDYYRNICNELHRRGMTACVTLYHWDLPSEYGAIGGWTNRKTAYAYAEYAKAMFRELSDVVDMWITINEPLCICHFSYLTGEHAPGHRNPEETALAIHHVLLAHGLAMKAYREGGYRAPIGITLNPKTPRPATRRAEDRLAADHRRQFYTEVFTGPLFGKGYPSFVTDEMGWKFPVQEGDMELISQKMDFLGINYYTEQAMSPDENAIDKCKEEPFWNRTNHIGWPVDARGLYRQLTWFREYTNNIPVYITENGSCEDDVLTADGRVHDYERIDYLRSHLKACADAIADGSDIRGYYAWSFIDNYEWAEGYAKRFGLVYCDYRTMKRYPKDSAYFMRDLMAGYADLY